MKNTTTQIRTMWCVQFPVRKGQHTPCFAHWSLSSTKKDSIAFHIEGTETNWEYFKSKGYVVRKVKHTLEII